MRISFDEHAVPHVFAGNDHDAYVALGYLHAPFSHVHGASYRAVYDFADLANSRYIIATGQSGNPLSRHYGDFARPWRDGETITLAGTAAQIDRRGIGVLTLNPSP